MANQVLAFSNRAIFYGHLNKVRSYRKRLIWIRRDFDPIDEGNTAVNIARTTPGKAYLTAAQYVANGNAIPNADPRLDWVGFNEPFLSDERLTQMTNPVQAMHRFSVIISSLPYIHFRTDLPARTGSLISYLRNHHRKQGGYHVYVRREGTVMTVVTYIDDQANQDYRVIGKTIAPLTAIYPVMRIPYPNENIQLTQPQLALGLYYNTFEEHLGDRYYHRYGDQCLQRGNVFEVLHQVIEAQNAVPFLNALIGETQPYVAFYVCTGAKLVVLDQYTGVNDQSHNRSLVQQGGIVLFKGDIMINMARTGPEIPEPDRNTLGLMFLPWNDLITNHMIPVVPNTALPDPNQNQKVIFLGAQDSRFNSIAWQMEVVTHHEERVISVLTPHDARFEAITNGPDAIREIRSRIYYELLHDSSLRDHGTQFHRPEPLEMAVQILNPNQSRSYVVRYEQGYIDRMDTHPREFNLVYPTGQNIEAFIQAQTMRLGAPPMYPPQLWKVGNDNEITYLPSTQLPYKEVDKKYISNIVNEHKQWSAQLPHHPQGKFNFKIGKYEAIGTQFERLKEVADQNFTLLNGRQGTAAYYRLGVDGWMYKSTNLHTFIENTNVYEKM